MTAAVHDVRAEDGHRLDCHVQDPAGPPRGTVIVLQEVFGVTGHIRRVMAGYAAEGYRAVAPALFDRHTRGLELPYDDQGLRQGLSIARTLRWGDTARDVAAALALAGGPVAVVGFCWGGTVAWVSAARVPGLQAAVSYYGGFIPRLLQERPRCPVLLHWAEPDPMVSAADRDAVAGACPQAVQHTYAAHHGFNCDERPVHDAAAAALARRRTLDFLHLHLPGQA